MKNILLLSLLLNIVSLQAADPATPTLAIEAAASGSATLRLNGEAGAAYKIQDSTDLRSWNSIAAIALAGSTSGTVGVTNKNPAVFYRAVSQATPTITQGPGATVISSLGNFAGGRIAKVGTITATNGTTWTLPAVTSFTTGAKASDLYNDVTHVMPANIAAVNLDAVPIVEIDPDGEVITGYLFADNYFELYVNGKLVGVDPVPYTPFNSCVVRFKAKVPVTYAVHLVDWEENLGIGSENNMGHAYYAGDGGFSAVFSDGTVTGNHWKAQTFYIAPLSNSSAVKELLDGTRDSSSNPEQPDCDGSCYAIHYTMPANWASPSFDDSHWPAATTYTEQVVGVDNKPAYTNFRSQFSGAQFIWSSNLVLDNDVIVRYTRTK